MGGCVSSEALMGMRHWSCLKRSRVVVIMVLRASGPSKAVAVSPLRQRARPANRCRWPPGYAASQYGYPSVPPPPYTHRQQTETPPLHHRRSQPSPHQNGPEKYTQSAILPPSSRRVCVCGFSDAVSGVRRALMSTVRCELGFGAFLLRPSCAAAHDLRQDRYSRAMTETEPTAFFRRSQPLASARTLPRLVPRAPSAPNVRRP